MGCASTQIPNVAVYREIPFVDGPEGVFIESTTHKRGLISAADWAKKKPFMLMIDPEGWDLIKKQWYEACRIAGEKCNVTVDSIDKLVKQLDAIARVAFSRAL